jgi:hemoglobin
MPCPLTIRLLPIRRRHLAPLALAAALLAGPAAAQPAVAESAGLYQRFGGQPGLVALMDDFMARLLADPRTAPFFEKVNQAHVKQQLVDQFCELLGGPCRYQGVEMKAAHQDLEIGKRDFNALVEALQAAMDARGIPFPAQNQLLARLAPMHRDIITAR